MIIRPKWQLNLKILHDNLLDTFRIIGNYFWAAASEGQDHTVDMLCKHYFNEATSQEKRWAMIEAAANNGTPKTIEILFDAGVRFKGHDGPVLSRIKINRGKNSEVASTVESFLRLEGD